MKEDGPVKGMLELSRGTVARESGSRLWPQLPCTTVSVRRNRQIRGNKQVLCMIGPAHAVATDRQPNNSTFPSCGRDGGATDHGIAKDKLA